MAHLEARVAFGVFLRSYLVTGAYNPQGLQNIGCLFALEPALVSLYGEGEQLAEARMRYAQRFNCHPFFTPLLFGVLLHCELAIIRQTMSPAMLGSIKDTTANALSALGDSLFNGTLLAGWALVCACCVVSEAPCAALLFSAACLFLLQIFKLGTFCLGLRKGMAVLGLLRRLKLMNVSELLKNGNALILALFLWLVLQEADIFVFAGVGLCLLCAAWAVGKKHVPRVLVALAAFAAAAYVQMF